MKRKMILIALTMVTLGAALALGNAPTFAKPADTYTVDWYTMDGGGTTSLSSGTYTLSGTIGQFDAGTESGGSYQLNGGFWGWVASLSKLFLPLITR